MTARLFYNPSCSKCRTAAAILAEEGVEATRVEYLAEAPRRDELTRLMVQLGIDDPRLMMRTGEAVYGQLGLADASSDELLEAITQHPILLERPIFVVGDRAVIARPPEKIRSLL